jgi:hypothetical protein
MNEQGKAKGVDKTPGMSPAADKPAGPEPQKPRAMSNPRDVATVVMAHMNMVNSKKDELTIAIKGLSDITQQLARAYVEQLQSIERLANRVKALEAAAGAVHAAGSHGAATPASAKH